MTQSEALQEQHKAAGRLEICRSDVDLLLDFLVPHIQHKDGTKTAWEVLYEWYSDWWGDSGGDAKYLSVAEFGAALAQICEQTPIAVYKARGRVYCLNVRLFDPATKALPAPTS